jgi:hypothetical protein
MGSDNKTLMLDGIEVPVYKQGCKRFAILYRQLLLIRHS